MTEVRGQILTYPALKHPMSESITRSVILSLIVLEVFSTSDNRDCWKKAANSLKLSAQVHKASSSFVCESLTKRTSPAVWAQSTTCLSPRFFHPSTRLHCSQLSGAGRLCCEFSKAVITKLSCETNVFVLTAFSVKLQLALLMPHFLPVWSLFKAGVIDFIPYNWPWDAALA